MLGFADQINTSTPGAYSVNNTVISYATADVSGTIIQEDSLKDIFGSTFSGKFLTPYIAGPPVVAGTNNTSLKTNAILGYSGVNAAPVLDAGSTYLTGAPSVADFTSTPSYYGAFGSTPDAGWAWSAGWVNFNPNNTTY